ncbi:hypothetical protein [Paenibacillus ihumii]|uniref:hypothetical protein n=1 Tax=Paenibacillus ihumii TaxID=687436 RepID=UPI000AFFBAF3|nr:hypothetical protein [Paenibacillus ihumii]
MKVSYPLQEAADLKEIKESLKPFGGRCAKIVDGSLEYQIKEEQESTAYEALKAKGYIS